VRNVSSSILLILVVLAMPSPVGAEFTAYFVGYAVEVPSPLQLLVIGFALLGIGALARKWMS